MVFVSKKGKKFVRFKFSGAKQNVYYLDFPFLILRTWGCYHVNKIIKEKDSYGAKTVPGNHAHKNMRNTIFKQVFLITEGVENNCVCLRKF